MKSDLVNLTIDGKPVQVPAGTTVLLAAKENNIEIPTLCYHRDLPSEGQCRLCVVEIGIHPSTQIVNSCTYPTAAGLVVQTHSDTVLQARRIVLELLLARTPKAKLIPRTAPRSTASMSPAFQDRRPGGTLHPLRALRPHLPGSGGGQRHQHEGPHPGQTGGHPLPGTILRLHRLRLLRLRLPHQRHPVYRKRRHSHDLGPGLELQPCNVCGNYIEPKYPAGTLG